MAPFPPLMVSFILAIFVAAMAGARPVGASKPGPNGPSTKYGWTTSSEKTTPAIKNCISSLCQMVSDANLGGLAGFWDGELEKVPLYSPSGKDEVSHASVMINSTGTTFDIQGGTVSRWTNKTVAVDKPRSCWLSLCMNNESDVGDVDGCVLL